MGELVWDYNHNQFAIKPRLKRLRLSENDFNVPLPGPPRKCYLAPHPTHEATLHWTHTRRHPRGHRNLSEPKIGPGTHPDLHHHHMDIEGIIEGANHKRTSNPLANPPSTTKSTCARPSNMKIILLRHYPDITPIPTNDSNTIHVIKFCYFHIICPIFHNHFHAIISSALVTL